MPAFLRPSAQRCIDFLSHPNAYVAQLPTGHDLYFTLPFDPEYLNHMRPQELQAFHDNLDMIQHEASVCLGNHTLENVPQVLSVISRRLSNSRCLSGLEMQGWTAGHGFPVFDDRQHPVDFDWDCNFIESKGLQPEYFHPVHSTSAGTVSRSICCAPVNYTFPPTNTPIDHSPYRGEIRNPMPFKSGNSVLVCGGTMDINEFLGSYTHDDLALLEEQLMQHESDNRCGIHRIWEPCAHTDLHFEHTSEGSWTDVESIEPTKTGKQNHQTKNESNAHSPKPLYSFEELYQRGLISYGLTVETNTLVPNSELYLLKMYKATRDQGWSERDALLTVVELKQGYPSRPWLTQEKPKRPAQKRRERMVQSKAAKSQPESVEKEHNRIYNEAGAQKARNARAAHENKKAKECSRQDTTQQVIRFQDHKQQTSSSSPVQEVINKCGHNIESVRTPEPWESRRNINDVDPNVCRTHSFQEPTRLVLRPRAVARPSSYLEDLPGSARSKPYRSSYQAYAEDSPEDSPRATPGSWRDV